MIDLSSINSNLLKSFIDNDFSGHDPFDSLNSKIFNLTPLKYSKIAKLIFTQLGKRSPINLRNLLLVPKSRNAKGVALIILGLIENFKISNDDYYLDQAKTLVDWLILNKCEKKIWSHNCWGYNFEWQARAFNVPKGSPNIVTTYFVSLAILKFSEITNNTELQNQALDSSFFMTKYLLNHNENEMTFNYVPNSKTFVHNANLFGAHWCLVAGKIMKNRGNSIIIDVVDHHSSDKLLLSQQHRKMLASTPHQTSLLYKVLSKRGWWQVYFELVLPIPLHPLHPLHHHPLRCRCNPVQQYLKQRLRR